MRWPCHHDACPARTASSKMVVNSQREPSQGPFQRRDVTPLSLLFKEGVDACCLLKLKASEKPDMNSTSGFLILAVLLLAAFSACHSTIPDSDSRVFSPQLKKSPGGSGGGFFGPGGGFNVPGFGPVPGFGNGISGGYGGGYGGPSGGYAKGGIVRPTVTCMDRGPCYKKKLRCPAKCFTSYSRSGKNYGSGGGGGGCTMDCKNKCVAYC